MRTRATWLVTFFSKGGGWTCLGDDVLHLRDIAECLSRILQCKKDKLWLHCYTGPQQRKENTNLVQCSLFCASRAWCSFRIDLLPQDVGLLKSVRDVQEKPFQSTGNPLGSATSRMTTVRYQFRSEMCFWSRTADMGMGKSLALPALLVWSGEGSHCSNPVLASRQILQHKHGIQGHQRCWPENGPHDYLWGLMLAGPNR